MKKNWGAMRREVGRQPASAGAMKSKWLLAPLLGLVLLGAFGRSEARAGYFIDAFAGSPLGTFLFGDVNNHTGATADSVTFFSNGSSVLSAEGFAATSLNTGALNARVSAQYGYTGACSTCDPLSAFGNANLGDSLTFLGSFTGQTVIFHASISGTWTTNGPGSGTFQFLTMPGGTIDQYSANEFALFDSSSPFYNPQNVGPNGTLPLTFDIPVVLNGFDPTIDIASSLDLTAFGLPLGASLNGDFSHTALLSFTAPAGVTVESASGVFPGTIPVPVPEPASLALFCTALAGLGLIRRRRRQVGQ